MPIDPNMYEEEAAVNVTPHMSYSKLSTYLACPERYRLQYVEKLYPILDSASLVFGMLIHKALAHFFRYGNNPTESFLQFWSSLQDVELGYGIRETWLDLRMKGQELMTKFLAEEAARITNVQPENIEKAFSFYISGLDKQFFGVIDLIADFDGVRTVIDFKTSALRYDPTEVVLSDQLTGYFLAEPDAKQVAYCVLLKQKEPKIEWHLATKQEADLVEYLKKVNWVAKDIDERKFYKRPGKHCAWCDYLPVCVRDEETAAKMLAKRT